MTAAIPAELQLVLRDPLNSLTKYGKIVDQETDEVITYDPYRLTDKMQATIVSYVSNPPRNDAGFTRWLHLLKARQGGASAAAALAFYPHTVYKEGHQHVTIADTQTRADVLHQRVMFCHRHWPDHLRVGQKVDDEFRQLTTVQDSVMQVLHAQKEEVGIGQSTASLLASEVAFWKNAGITFTMLYPAMRNKRNSIMVVECTPAILDKASAEWWMNKCDDAREMAGRDLYAFFPYWDVKLNRRPWRDGDVLENSEIRLLERWGPAGLTHENLAFRRETIDTDAEIRRMPELFDVFYPSDDLSCWIRQGAGVIPHRVLDPHMDNLIDENTRGYTEFRPPMEGAVYVIGVDPTAWGGRDHAAFQVLEVWDDGWDQVASYGAVTDPNEFADILVRVAQHYNGALVAVERNNPACLAILKEKKYRNLYYGRDKKPGVWTSSHQVMVDLLVDALLDKDLNLRGRETMRQLRGYRSDKETERTVRQELLSKSAGNRRERHHWDRVSALMMAVVAAPSLPRRIRRKSMPDNVIPFGAFTWNDLQAYEVRKRALAGNVRERRFVYKRRRRS